MEKLKDTLFVIGSGSSLNKIDMSKLANQDTISMNRQYIAYDEWGFKPTYYVIIDRQLVLTIHKDVEKLIKEEKDIKKFFIMSDNIVTTTNWIEKMRSEEKGRVFKLHGKVTGPYRRHLHRTVTNLDNRGMSFDSNAGACAVEIGLCLGYKRVVLLGIDAKYVDRKESVKANKDLSHFHPNYFDVKDFKEGVNQGPHNENSGVLLWKLFSEQQKKIGGFEIISSTPSSPINQYLTYVEFDTWFNESNN